MQSGAIFCSCLCDGSMVSGQEAVLNFWDAFS